MDQFFKYEKPILKKVNLVQVLWSTKTALSPDENTARLSTRPLACPPMTTYVYLTSNKNELLTFLYAKKSVT